MAARLLPVLWAARAQPAPDSGGTRRMFVRVLAERSGDRPGVVEFAGRLRSTGEGDGAFVIMVQQAGVAVGEVFCARKAAALRPLLCQLIGLLPQSLDFGAKLLQFSR